MKKKLLVKLLVCIVFNLIALNSTAQRKMEKLDRGVVAVRNTTGDFFVSWRYLATDQENLQFNLYAKKVGASGFTKLNSGLLSLTNFSPTSGSVATGTQLYVTPVINGVESSPSGIFTIPGNGFTSYRSAFMDITYNPVNDGLAFTDYYTKFVWPVDLDGDGEYDYVVDRKAVAWSNTSTDKIQGYLRNGTLLWTIDMGPNCQIDYGSADMVTAYDMDGDGKSEVIIKSSEGTKFANGYYVKGYTTPDIDGDGIVNYEAQSKRNPPYYMTVVDGMTGNEKISTEFDYSKTLYTRDNKAIFMGDEYNKMVGHMGVLYLDGKHPSVGFIYNLRTLDGFHNYYVTAFGYNSSKQWVQQYLWSRGQLDAAEGHGLRVADVDFDGHDEMLDIGYGIKYDGTLAFNAHISHGDRFRIGDIDPERPGLETFAIQQNASSLLGQILYKSESGVPIKKWYLTSVSDVGRGECMDVDSTKLGYEMWSTMPNIYNAKGNIVYEGSTPFPYEGVWWDGDLSREELAAADGSGYNADVRRYDPTSHSFGSRLIEFAKMTGWAVKSMNGVRPAFFGDIAGDWREEVILAKKGTANVTLKDINGIDSIGAVETCPGIVGFSTDYPTSKRIYCLMQNPAYRLQCTAKGYYQSSYPDFYLGYNMPTPPIAPVQSAKLTWKSGTTFDKNTTNFLLSDEATTSSFTDGDDIMFDISGDNSSNITLNADVSPSKLWAMNPLGKDYTLTGVGKLTGTMELVKSMYGTFTLNGNHTYTGKTTISEGTLCVNGSIASPINLLAKGTLSGNSIVNGGITLNPGLNIEGGRLAPGNGLLAGKLGKMTINSNVTMAGKVTVHIDVLPFDAYKNDTLQINGNITLSGINQIYINTESGVLPSGTYSLIHWTGSLTGSVSNFVIAGISGLPMSLIIENNTLKLIVNATRTAGAVKWTGKENGNWDYLSANFKQNENPTYFVNGDTIQFNDSALVKTVILADTMTVANTTMSNEASYVLKGAGGISGSGGLTKSGRGLLDIQTTNNWYRGKTVLNNTVVQVAGLADGNNAGSLGAASSDAGNMTMTNSKLIVNAVSTNSNRGISLIGNDTINVPKSNGVVAINGLLTGSGSLVVNGPGQLNVSGTVANTYTGSTVISGIRLSLGNLLMNSYGLGTGTITLLGGATLRMYYNINTSSYQTSTWNLTVPDANAATLIASGRCTIAGTLNGAGTLNYQIPYVRADWATNCSNFSGILNVTSIYSGGSGTFRITTNTNGLPLCTVNLGAQVDMGAYSSIGASSTSTSTAVKIGALAGVAGSTVNGGTYTIGGNNKDAVFNGVINAGATITKTGTGSWTLTGANTTTSPFTISGGKVIVSNASGSATGTGNVTVGNSAVLTGTGIITGSVTMGNGSNLTIGNGSMGTLTLSSNLILQTGSKTTFKVSGSTNDKLNVGATMVLKGTLEMINQGVAYQSGNSYTIFTAATSTGMFDAVSPATPGQGLKWNTSLINSGIISVDIADGIEDVEGSTIRVYPSLINDFCMVSIGGLSGEVKVELIREVGQVISSRITSSTSQSYKVEMSGMTPGMYFVKITNSNGRSFLRKVIKL